MVVNEFYIYDDNLLEYSSDESFETIENLLQNKNIQYYYHKLIYLIKNYCSSTNNDIIYFSENDYYKERASIKSTITNSLYNIVKVYNIIFNIHKN